jgi:ParB family chromosome partitioning protein
VLEASILARGIKQPITVRWDAEGNTYRVIDGGRRYEAARRIGLEQIPCWVQQVEEGRDVLIDQVVHNWVRADLEPLETAIALARLRDEFGMSAAEISTQIGKPRGDISKFLKIHDKTSDSVKRIAQSPSDLPLTKRHLYNLSKLSAVKQENVLQRIQRERLNAVQTEELVTEMLRQEAPQTKQTAFGKRQRRFNTALADVLVTFRKASSTDDDLRAVLREIEASLREPTL